MNRQTDGNRSQPSPLRSPNRAEPLVHGEPSACQSITTAVGVVLLMGFGWGKLHHFSGSRALQVLRPGFPGTTLMPNVHMWSCSSLMNLYGGTLTTCRYQLSIQSVLHGQTDRWWCLHARWGAKSSCFYVCSQNSVKAACKMGSLSPRQSPKVLLLLLLLFVFWDRVAL